MLAFDLLNLSTDQKAADSFFRSVIPNLAGTVLSGGQQNGNFFNYQYIKQTTPLTITQVSANRYDQNQNLFQLAQTIQTINGPVNGGTLTSVLQSYSVNSFTDALANLHWN
jgi:hypothetical protein